MSPKAKPIVITLYAPSIDVTIEKFHLTPSQSHATILKGISKALGNISQAWPYNTKHEPIEDFKTLEEGQNLLIATCYSERPLADKVDDVLTVQPGAAYRAWEELDVQKKKEYIASFTESNTYLTLPYSEVQSRLTDTSVPTVKSCLATTEENWGLPLDAILGFRGMVMPYGEMETWQPELLPALAVLSGATIGQGMVISGLIIDEVKRRRGGHVEARDVVEVGRELYRKADG
jgi:hypothetical protein